MYNIIQENDCDKEKACCLLECSVADRCVKADHYFTYLLLKVFLNTAPL